MSLSLAEVFGGFGGGLAFTLLLCTSWIGTRESDSILPKHNSVYFILSQSNSSCAFPFKCFSRWPRTYIASILSSLLFILVLRIARLEFYDVLVDIDSRLIDNTNLSFGAALWLSLVASLMNATSYLTAFTIDNKKVNLYYKKYPWQFLNHIAFELNVLAWLLLLLGSFFTFKLSEQDPESIDPSILITLRNALIPIPISYILLTPSIFKPFYTLTGFLGLNRIPFFRPFLHTLKSVVTYLPFALVASLNQDIFIIYLVLLSFLPLSILIWLIQARLVSDTQAPEEEIIVIKEGCDTMHTIIMKEIKSYQLDSSFGLKHWIFNLKDFYFYKIYSSSRPNEDDIDSMALIISQEYSLSIAIICFLCLVFIAMIRLARSRQSRLNISSFIRFPQEGRFLSSFTRRSKVVLLCDHTALTFVFALSRYLHNENLNQENFRVFIECNDMIKARMLFDFPTNINDCFLLTTLRKRVFQDFPRGNFHNRIGHEVFLDNINLQYLLSSTDDSDVAIICAGSSKHCLRCRSICNKQLSARDIEIVDYVISNDLPLGSPKMFVELG